jgi:hypothetical protein
LRLLLATHLCPTRRPGRVARKRKLTLAGVFKVNENAVPTGATRALMRASWLPARQRELDSRAFVTLGFTTGAAGGGLGPASPALGTGGTAATAVVVNAWSLP